MAFVLPKATAPAAKPPVAKLIPKLPTNGAAKPAAKPPVAKPKPAKAAKPKAVKEAAEVESWDDYEAANAEVVRLEGELEAAKELRSGELQRIVDAYGTTLIYNGERHSVVNRGKGLFLRPLRGRFAG